MKRVVVLLVASACGQPAVKPDGGTAEQPISTMQITGAPCAISIEQWPLGDATHFTQGAPLTWPSNPPASGPHYSRWAAFQEFTTAVPRGNYVHSLEHGAVVLLYNCDLVDAATCDAIKTALRAATTSLPDDSKCSGLPTRVRTVMTPDSALTEPLVAVSWGFIYRAACVDQTSLNAFASAHYAQGPEDLCAAGVTSF
ncbi:MAG: DUF3105 domain-containing protein [Archangium sp.]|nr:DUF3105 domain-containing protein [Archangium sp.]